MRKGSWGRAALLVCNLVMILIAGVLAVLYSENFRKENSRLQMENFCTAVESMKQLSESYLYTEKGYVDDWAQYITHKNMTMDEAIEYLRTANTQKDRYAHIVDMDDMSARSTYLKNGSDVITAYQAFREGTYNANKTALRKMEKMFTSTGDEVLILGKYRVGETQQSVISVGTKVEIKIGKARRKPYLLLRVIPVDYLQRAWVFPTEYPSAEISIITSDGEYVVQSASMKSRSFLDYIRGYNFQDDYNEVEDLAERLRTTEKGLLQYKNFRGEDCYWYYSSFGRDLELDILGYIPVNQMNQVSVDWNIVWIVCGSLLFLTLMDGVYILSINKKLKRALVLAEQANQAKTDFLSTVSHDIRTPMNAVIGMTDLARKHLDDPKYMGECLSKVAWAGNHLLTLINDILDISKIESGKMELEIQPFSLREAIDEIVSMVRPQAEQKKITFDVKMNEIICDALAADQLRLNQILLNLLTNAVKYTENGGRVLLEISEERIEQIRQIEPVEQTEPMGQTRKNGRTDRKEAEDGRSSESRQPQKIRLICKVADNGMGMSPEFQKTMYHSFTREEDSRISKIQGTGLGLAIIRQLVDLMNGSIMCESEIGKGTTFTVYLDLDVAEQETDVLSQDSDWGEEADRCGLSDLHILVAEDNDLNWEIIQAILSEYEIPCDRAENGKICVEMLASSPKKKYDLILMDIQMPMMNGREATRTIRKMEESGELDGRIPIIAMTADAFAEDIRACREAGMDGHLAKPINIKQVLGALKKIKKAEMRDSDRKTR
ncbi:hybrid sensor histidine kinase/response regulator [Brotaphodocola sp.]|uniref:hybrid sensor histidine kinase/response regulator n=1 Tax=Brotaphodocola sp. TaxID=3073577 RepID=UPI003D7E2205